MRSRPPHKAGHEIAGMSYSFERVRTASREREQRSCARPRRCSQDICGATIKGWRCPDYRVSPQTLDILSAEGFAWDSSMLNDDLPYLLDCEGGKLIEIPFTTSTADKTYVGYPYPMRGGPDGLANVWNSEFDMLYRESERAPRFMILSMQTWATGRPAPLRTLRQFLERVIAHNDVQFARCGEIAAWCNGQASGTEADHVERNSAEAGRHVAGGRAAADHHQRASPVGRGRGRLRRRPGRSVRLLRAAVWRPARRLAAAGDHGQARRARHLDHLRRHLREISRRSREAVKRRATRSPAIPTRTR